MSFIEKVRGLAERSKQAEKLALTEEATKTSVILPFIQALGFDYTNLLEVIPEYTVDFGIKKGEKVDFALKIGGDVAILIEAKPINMDLGSPQVSQLFRYFSVEKNARVAILTNGRELYFYSDTKRRNEMDKKPFLKIDLQEITKKQIDELSNFRKDDFSVETILETASNQKLIKEAAKVIKKELKNPSNDFIKFVAKSFYEGSLTKKAIDDLKPAIAGAIDEVFETRLFEKHGVAFPRSYNHDENEASSVETENENGIETTEEEIQAFMIVKAITMPVIDIKRVTMRDSKSYCSVFADNNNRKPICRFYFNSKTNLQLGIFNAEREEVKHKINGLEDMYNFAEELRTAAIVYAN